MAVFEEIRQCLIDGDIPEVVHGVNTALEQGMDAEDILNNALISGMTTVGQLFEDGDYFIPEMLMAARAMQEGVAILKPQLIAQNVKPLGKVVIGTVKGDLHDIGKNLVAMMLEGVGFEVIDLGSDVAPEKFVDAVRQHQAHFIGMSALLTTTMSGMKICIEELKQAGIRDQVIVMVGGSPVSQKYADDIGADIYAADGASAARKAKERMAAN